MSDQVVNNLELNSSAGTLADVHALAMQRFRECEQFESRMRTEALEDLRFLEGDQWMSEDIVIRMAKSRPYLTFNRMAPFVDQIVGDMQRAVFNLNVAPFVYHSGKFSPEGGPTEADRQFSLAQVYDGYIKSLGLKTATRRARNVAFEYQVACGFGYYRVYADYVGEMSFDQDIVVMPLHNPFTVMMDPVAMFRGPEFAQFGFVFDSIPNHEFRRRFNDRMSTGFGASVTTGMGMDGWYLDDAVRVAEYFVKRFVDTELVQLSDGRVYKVSDYERDIDKFEQEGVGPARFKKVKIPQVYWYLMDGNGIIKGPKEFPSKFIPIIPVFGKMRVVDGEVMLRGAVRFSRDAQRLYNYSETATAELISNAPKNQWLIDWDSVPGPMREDYKKANLDMLPALYYVGSKGNAPVRERPAEIQPGFAQLTERAWENLKGTIGMFNDALGDMGPTVSAKAINARTSESDTISVPFITNFEYSLEYEGKVVVDMIPRVLDSQRILKIVDTEDADVYLTINKVEWDPATTTWKITNELSHTDVSVFVQTGPSAKTQRLEAVEVMSNALRDVGQADPRIIPILLKQIALNSDWAGSRDFGRIMDKLIPPELKDISQDSDMVPKEMLQSLVQQGIEQALQEAGVKIEEFDSQTKRMQAESGNLRALVDVYEARIKEFDSRVKAYEVHMSTKPLPAGPIDAE